ncbi:MAG: hypothetical protein ACXWUR_10065 [Allosphingosinicella sp.]
MWRQLVAGAASTLSCLVPAMAVEAQESLYSSFEPPRGATATINLRVPLGHRAQPARPSLGLTVAFGQPVGSPLADGRTAVRQFRLADFRLDRRGVSRAELVTFDLAHPGRDGRLHIGGAKKSYVLAVLTIAAGVTTLLLLADGEDKPPIECVYTIEEGGPCPYSN